VKTVTDRWPEGVAEEGSAFHMPTMK
jgi:hypothetical protein